MADNKSERIATELEAYIEERYGRELTGWDRVIITVITKCPTCGGYEVATKHKRKDGEHCPECRGTGTKFAVRNAMGRNLRELTQVSP